LHENGLDTSPKVIAELGPGSSLGVGIAGLLSGANTYYSLDVLQSANIESNLKVFEDLVQLFQRRSDIPDNNEFVGARPQLKSYSFPHHILREDRLAECLRSDRIDEIKKAIGDIDSKKKNSGPISIRYFVPWDSPEVISEQSVDFIYSQAVLEHVANLPIAYEAMSLWLKKDGIMSHRIDFRSRGF